MKMKDKPQEKQYIIYSRVADYWAADLPVNRGRWNFDTLRYDYYLDDNVAFEAFKAGAVDRREETVAKNWATRYVGRNFSRGYIIKDEHTNTSAQDTQWLAFNIQRPIFADRRVRQAITRALADQARTIRIPVHMVETINKVIRVSRQLLQELGHDPSPNEIAKEMNMPVDKVREILKIAQEPVSLETPIGEEEDSHLGDFIPDEGASEPSEAASFTLLKEQLVDVLGTLTPREEKVLKLRFGIEDGRTRTLEEVGKEFNVTRERIRQIEAKALRKLRHPSRSKKLKDFLN